jgi:hypothetical protein
VNTRRSCSSFIAVIITCIVSVAPTVHGDRLVLAAKVTVTMVCLTFAFVLYWFHREGAAYFLGIISGSPAQGFAAAVVQKSAAKATTTEGEQVRPSRRKSKDRRHENREENMIALEPVSLALLETVFSHMDGRVGYVLGAKAPSLTCDTSQIHTIDCSGFSRYILARATNGLLVLPDGSQNQLAWASQEGLQRLANYSDVQFAAADPSRLFIGFLKPGSDGIGHVFLLRSRDGGMLTRESHGHHGVDARAWDTPALAGCHFCFELPAVA